MRREPGRHERMAVSWRPPEAGAQGVTVRFPRGALTRVWAALVLVAVLLGGYFAYSKYFDSLREHERAQAHLQTNDLEQALEHIEAYRFRGSIELWLLFFRW